MAAPEGENLPVHPRRASAFRMPRRRSPSGARPRRMPTVRLGGRRGWGWRMAGAFRRIRMRWLAAQYRRALKRMKAFYSGLMRDLIEGAAAMEAVHSGTMMEAYLAIPVIPVRAVTLTSGHYASYLS